MIPPDEMERLLIAAATAAALAQSGQIRIGYDWLQAGYRHALDYDAEGLECPGKLAERWRQLIDAYCAEFELPLAGSDREAPPVCAKPF
ncbi:MAG: hypothetical protein ACO1SX_19035 [Actinomycetota bacterium]